MVIFTARSAWAGLNHIRYSGSALALSFDEADTTNKCGCWTLPLPGSAGRKPTRCRCPAVRKRWLPLSGDLASLPAIVAVAAQAAERPVWLEVRRARR